MSEEIWLIGAGQMASDYAKVLKELSYDFTVIGRSEKSAKEFEYKTGVSVVQGGLENAISSASYVPKYAIVAVNVEHLAHITTLLIKYGVKNILVEKPAGLEYQEIKNLCEFAVKNNISVFIAYNRHFYASVIRAKEIIEDDGGVVSFNFEFTEWSHIIEKFQKPREVFENWFLTNSTHVVDLAFYLGGYPTKISCYTSGSTDWYERASVFCGAGVTDIGALFSYQANWKGPGRWGVEFITPKHRLILRPMEKLQIQHIGSVITEFVDIDDEMEKEFKPGLYLQIRDFIENRIDSRFVSIQQHCKNIKIYQSIENI
ncbi:Gfo/Idh/MocA family protein [Sporomusa malonica]|nr:Gfo/Idh/MocA family oxidoreductase [Sporomusa malonica]